MVVRIAIVGGGIGGLTLAVALSKLKLNGGGDVKIDIYEAASELTQVGAGITFWPRAWKILEKLGLAEALSKHLPPDVGASDNKRKLAFQIRKADQEEGAKILDLYIPGAALNFHRAVVQSVLLENIDPDVQFHLSHRLTSYSVRKNASESDPLPNIELTFSNGTVVTCNILVGAYGLRSIVRQQFNDPQKCQEGTGLFSHAVPGIVSDLVWSGSFAYRFSVDSVTLHSRISNHRVFTTPVIYCGKNKVESFLLSFLRSSVNESWQHIVAYPILQGKIVNVVAYVSDVSREGTPYTGSTFEDVTREEFVSEYDLWEEEVRVLVHNAQNASRWAIHSIKPQPLYANEGIVLLGDAAHAMTPHQGNGAGQAIEDAYILASLIRHTLSHGTATFDVNRLCDIYTRVRQPVANTVQEASRKHGLLYEFNDPAFPFVAREGDSSLSADRLDELGSVIVSDWEYAWSSDAEGDRKKALEMLRGVW